MNVKSSKMKRLITLVLAFAMVLTTVAPTNVEAAKRKSYVTSLSVSKSTVSVKAGRSVKLTAKVKTVKSASKKVTVKSSNKSVAKVSVKNGKTSSTLTITGVKKGTAKVTVTTSDKKKNGKKISKTITVKVGYADVTGVSVSPASKTLEVGDSVSLKSVVKPSTASKTVTYTSSNPAVAAVSSKGVVKAVASGSAVITAKAGTKKATCKVVVKEKAVDVTGVVLDQENISLTVTETSQLIATVNPEDASDKSLQWTSSNPVVAKVNGEGLVSALAEGEATITVTAGNGKFKDSCTVTVRRDTSNNASAASITIANSLAAYPNTVLTGTNADVKVLVTNANGTPLGNTSVTLEIEPQYGNASNVFGITGDNNNYVSAKLTTDKDGYASFTVGEKGGYSFTSTDQKYQSYKLTATVTGSGIKAESTLSFACIYTSDVEILNNRDISIPDIAPGENAEAVWPDGIAYTHSTNGVKNQEYVSSQKVSTGKENHSVYISATPYIVLPARNNQTEINKYYKDDFKKSSGKYSVYNDETNEETTSWIKGVPAGLQYATLVFDQIKLSKYTTLQIKTYDSVSGACINTYIMDETNMKSNDFGYQIPIQEDRAVDVEVALISEGQINDDSNDGFVISHVEGLYKTQVYEESDIQELDATVTWEKSTTYYSEYRPMSSSKAAEYIKDSNYISAKYNYAYEVPTFPNTGDAVIKVTDENGSVVAYFLYPTENQWKNADGSIYPTNTTVKNTNDLSNNAGYENKNDISLPLPDKYTAAVKASEEEVTNSVGTVRQEGNVAVVDSKYSGRTNLKAKISIPGVASEQLNETNGSELYTSVQWAPIPEEQTVEAGDDFYAIATQLITVKAQLYDGNGNTATTTKDKKVTFKVDGQEITEKELQKLGTNTNVTIEKKDEVSNDQGQAIIQFTAGDDKGFVHHLTAECEGYNVKLLVGPREDETKMANLYWVKLGLSFTDKVAYKKSVDNKDVDVVSTTTSTLDGKHEVESLDSEGKLVKNVASRKVGHNWIFGYELVGDFDHDDTISTNVVQKVSNVKVVLSKSDVTGMTMVTEGMPNGAAKVYSEKTGSATIEGAIGNDSFADESASTVQFTIADEEGNFIGNYMNVGKNAPSVQEKLSLNVSWEYSGKQAHVIYPQGNTLNVNEESKAYIQVVDDYGNPIENEAVTYSITGVNEQTNVTAKTDSNGLVEITLAAPGVSAKDKTTRISTVVDGTSYSGDTLTYKTTTDSKFALMGAELDASDADQPEIVLTFSGSVNRSVLKTDMFKITSTMDGVNSYAIDSVRIGNDNNVVILKLKAESKNIVNDTGVVTVSVKDYEEKGVVYKLVDTNGRYVVSTYSSAQFTPKNKYTIEAKVSTDNKKISLVVKDGNGDVVSNLSTQKVRTVNVYSSVAEVLASGKGVYKQTNLNDITVSPIESNTTVFIYYCGAKCSVTVKQQ